MIKQKGSVNACCDRNIYSWTSFQLFSRGGANSRNGKCPQKILISSISLKKFLNFPPKISVPQKISDDLLFSHSPKTSGSGSLLSYKNFRFFSFHFPKTIFLINIFPSQKSEGATDTKFRFLPVSPLEIFPFKK